MTKCYYSITCNIKLLHNVSLKDLNEYMSNLINRSMLRDEYLKRKHQEPIIKGYVFSNLYPYEKDYLYKKDKIYSFYINLIDQNTALRLKNCLEQEDFILDISLKVKKFKKIRKLKSNSLCISSIKNEEYNKRYWTKDKSTAKLLSAINNNANQKYNLFLGPIDKNTNFIQSIHIRNQKDIVANYKNGKLIGYQADIYIKEDEQSQLLANICLATGIGEKNSLGCGFCIINKEE